MQRSLHNDSVLDRALAATHQTAMRISQMHYVNWMIGRNIFFTGAQVNKSTAVQAEKDGANGGETK